MGDRSGIEWTDATWNPVVGCTRVSAGCDNCYAVEFIDQVFAVMACAGNHTFQVLTKRPERAKAYLTEPHGGYYARQRIGLAGLALLILALLTTGCGSTIQATASWCHTSEPKTWSCYALGGFTASAVGGALDHPWMGCLAASAFALGAEAKEWEIRDTEGRKQSDFTAHDLVAVPVGCAAWFGIRRLVQGLGAHES